MNIEKKEKSLEDKVQKAKERLHAFQVKSRVKKIIEICKQLDFDYSIHHNNGSGISIYKGTTTAKAGDWITSQMLYPNKLDCLINFLQGYARATSKPISKEKSCGTT